MSRTSIVSGLYSLFIVAVAVMAGWQLRWDLTPVVWWALGLVMFAALLTNQPIQMSYKRNEKTRNIQGRQALITFNNRYAFPWVLTIYLITLVTKDVDVLFLWIHTWSTYISGSNTVLWILFLSCLIFAITHDKQTQARVSVSSLSKTAMLILLVSVLTIAATYLIWYQTSDVLIKWLQLLISLVAGVLVFLLGILVIEDQEISHE